MFLNAFLFLLTMQENRKMKKTVFAKRGKEQGTKTMTRKRESKAFQKGNKGNGRRKERRLNWEEGFLRKTLISVHLHSFLSDCIAFRIVLMFIFLFFIDFHCFSLRIIDTR